MILRESKQVPPDGNRRAESMDELGRGRNQESKSRLDYDCQLYVGLVREVMTPLGYYQEVPIPSRYVEVDDFSFSAVSHYMPFP